MKEVLRRIHSTVYARRIAVLSDMMVSFLDPGDRVLDVGAGGGMLGATILQNPQCPKGVRYEGLECRVRPDSAIPMHGYDGDRIPFEDDSFDIVVLADVLHHEREPARLFAECARVARRFVIVKDHRSENVLDWFLVSALDWAANGPYGVPCLFRYMNGNEWAQFFSTARVAIVEEVRSIKLYPCGWNAIFGGRLQYFAVLRKSGTG